MINDDYPLADSNPSDFEKNGETTDEGNIAAYMNSELARAVFEAELEAMARGEFPGPTPRIGAWTEAHELMAEVESPSYMSMDTSRGELFEEDEELSHLRHEQGRHFADDGFHSRRRVCTVAQARRFASNREVIRRIRRPREVDNIQKQPRRMFKRMNPQDR